MDLNAEYHDPDYPEASTSSYQERPVLTEEERIKKIKIIVCREFATELSTKEEELNVIDQRVLTARRMLHRLRYALVSQYYAEHKLQLSTMQVQDEVAAQHEPRAKTEVCSILRNEQKRIHPSIKKLLGRNTVDLEEIFKFRAPRNKVRKDYMAMVQSKNYTIAAETSPKSLRPDIKQEPLELGPKRLSADTQGVCKTKKVPRYIEPKNDKNIVTLDEVTRNKQKHRYRIIIGNTSKYAPPSSKVDRSTHKWLLYVRGPPSNPEVSAIVTSLTVTLHETYAPHHVVHIDKPPFHISRRGWGEFPAKVELHFAQPLMNRPVSLDHTIKLDRNYTGLQTLGAETIVDVWLYSDEEMLKYEFKENVEPPAPSDVLKEVKLELTDNDPTVDNSWMDFFTTETTELDVDEMIIKPIKKEKPNDQIDLEKQIESNIIKKEIDWSFDNVSNEAITSLDKIKTEPVCEYENLMVTNELPNEILNQSPPKKRIMKYMDPNTGKIYYLEIDINLDISKVQEIIINSKNNTKTAKISPIKPVVNGLKNIRKTPRKGGVSLLKPEVKNLISNNLKTDKQKSVLKLKNNYSHIENDHCYISTPKHLYRVNSEANCVLPHEDMAVDHNVANCENDVVENVFDKLCGHIARFTCIRMAINYLLSKIPLISDTNKEYFPFVANSEDEYWTLDVIKRRNIEWSRAKLINVLLTKHFNHHTPIWRTKQILLYARLHGHYPTKPEKRITENTNEWSSWLDLEKTRELQSNIKEIYQNSSQITSLSIFQNGDYENKDGAVVTEIDLTADEDIDVLNVGSPVKKEPLPVKSKNITVLPVDNEDERLRYLFIEKKCADLGIELRNEDVGSGYSYSAVHAVMLAAMKKYAEELIRTALSEKLMETRNREPGTPIAVWTSRHEPERPLVALQHVYRAAIREPRLHTLTGSALATEPTHYTNTKL